MGTVGAGTVEARAPRALEGARARATSAAASTVLIA